LSMLSGYWIGGMHAVFWLLQKRGLGDDNDKFKNIQADLELVRVGLEKHEIPKDRNLTLHMVAQPRNHADTDFYTYDFNDQTRAHRMPMGLSERGSMLWQVIDGGGQSSRWIERRALSDQILELAN